MGKKYETMEMTGLQFFGQISASISHEIKNVLAVINENAGLIEDFTMMADRGKPIDPARLKTIAVAVQKQIGRADGIIRNMNRFAHSADQTFTDIDLVQTMELFMALTARFAAMKGVQVDLELPRDPVELRTAPFILMNVLWRCLDFSMFASGVEKRIELVVENTGNGARFQFRRLTGLTEGQLENFPTNRETYLLEILNADLTIDKKYHAIELQLSNSSDNKMNS